MILEQILETPFTPDVRKAQFTMLKEYLESGQELDYDAFEILYDAYYFIARPMAEDKEILELLSQYSDYMNEYWDSIEMPWNENEDEDDEDEDNEDDDDFELYCKEHPLYQIAQCITNGNPFVLYDVQDSISNCEAYYKAHERDYKERGIYEEDCEEEPLEICWIGLADSLKRNGYAIEIARDESALTLADRLARCELIRANSSLLNKGWFSKEEGILEGCRTLNKKWRGQGFCLVIMDIHCDSYVFFPCKEKELENLQNLAAEMEYLICHSKVLEEYEKKGKKDLTIINRLKEIYSSPRLESTLNKQQFTDLYKAAVKDIYPKLKKKYKGESIYGISFEIADIVQGVYVDHFRTFIYLNTEERYLKQMADCDEESKLDCRFDPWSEWEVTEGINPLFEKVEEYLLNNSFFVYLLADSYEQALPKGMVEWYDKMYFKLEDAFEKEKQTLRMWLAQALGELRTEGFWESAGNPQLYVIPFAGEDDIETPELIETFQIMDQGCHDSEYIDYLKSLEEEDEEDDEVASKKESESLYGRTEKAYSPETNGNETTNYKANSTYSQMANQIYEKLTHLSAQEESEYEYARFISTMDDMIAVLDAKHISQNDKKEAIKIAIYMRIYLFSMPHMAYPEELRRSFFETCWKLYQCFGENGRGKNFAFDPETEFLLRITSSKTPAAVSIWNEEQLEQSICTCCGKKLSAIAFADCKKKQPVSKLVEEWDLLAVAKNMTSKAKENFSLYKKVAKLFGLITCEECVQEQTLLDAYLAWCYENTYLNYPDEKLLEWLYQECQTRLSDYNYREQRGYYYQLIVDYAQGMKDMHKPTLLKYYEALYDSYKYNRAKYADELKHYKEKCDKLAEELLQDPNLSKEEQIQPKLIILNSQYENLGKKVQSPQEFEEECNQLAASYDEVLGKGNEKSTNCKLRLALSLGEKRNTQEEAKHGIEILLEQLEIVKTYNPTETKIISEICNRISYINKVNLKNYEEAIKYFEYYLKYIEDTYGKDSDYAFDEQMELKELLELYAKQKRKQQNGAKK